MNILVINAGSSSLKFQYINPKTEKVLIKGHYDGLNRKDNQVTLKISIGNNKSSEIINLKTTSEVADNLIKILLEKEIIKDLSDIKFVGHRVVHGAENYSKTTKIDDKMLRHLKSISFLAPLHNPINIEYIEILLSKINNAQHFAVFDTAFHQTIAPEIYLYGLPHELYEKFKIRKYGFHGISHKYVSKKASDLLEKKPCDLKIINCHLGNGQSICAIHKGKSFDTSMGFTPLEGLPMGTRSGSFDPEIILFLLENGYSKEEIKNLINKESGLYGISKISADHREIEDLSQTGNPDAKLANDILVNRIVSIIGSYISEMNGVDVIVFTGGIGEKSAYLRKLVLDHFGYLNIICDHEKNSGHDLIISDLNSHVTVMVVPTNEELQIAKEVCENIKTEEEKSLLNC